MRNTIIAVLFLFNTAFAQVKSGEIIPGVSFKTILNAPVKQSSLDALKGKVVVLDFWATWCSPCIAAMPHLEDLQKQYPDKLRVITLTEESFKRTAQFVNARPSGLWFGVDSAGVIAKLFPHSIIPHTVLIGPDGRLLAATSPENVTPKVVDSILNGKELHLPPSGENLMSVDDILKSYFHADDTVKNRFLMQPEIKGSPGFSNNYLTNPAFFGRRITAVNLNLLSLYEIGYGGFPFSRIINRMPKEYNKTAYCLDIIAAKKEDLLPSMQKELHNRFDVRVKIEPQLREVYVLKITDTNKFKTLPVNTTGTPTYFERQGEIDQQDMTMANFAEYLENYCVNTEVINETGNSEKLDIKFSYAPEVSHSLTNALAAIGLSITREKRKIDILVLDKDGQGSKMEGRER